MVLTDKFVFTQIWRYPRKVFKLIHRTGYDKYFNTLLLVTGIISMLQRQLDKGLEQNEVVSTIVISIIFGYFYCWLGTYIYASLISFTGRWLDGKAKTHRILRTLTYANIPFVFLIFIYAIQVYFLKYDVLNESFSGSEQAAIRYGFIAIKIILTSWTVVLYVIGIAEVQEFSILNAILNLLAPVLLFLVPIGILLLFFYIIK